MTGCPTQQLSRDSAVRGGTRASYAPKAPQRMTAMVDRAGVASPPAFATAFSAYTPIPPRAILGF